MRERYSFDETDGSGRLFVILVIVALAFLAGWHLSKDEVPATVPESEVVVAPPAAPERVREAPATARSSEPRTRSKGPQYVGVYECTENGQRVVSDRPCAAGAAARVLVVDPPKAPPPQVPKLRSSTPTASTSARSPSGATSTTQSRSAGNAAACSAVDEAIDRLNERMRQPYSSQEGEYLRRQWHALKERRYDLRCGRS